MDILKEDYARKRDRVLVDSVVAFDVDFTLYLDRVSEKLAIKPSAADIYRDCMYQIRQFIKEMEKVGFKLVRTESFEFIINVAERSRDHGED